MELIEILNEQKKMAKKNKEKIFSKVLLSYHNSIISSNLHFQCFFPVLIIRHLFLFLVTYFDLVFFLFVPEWNKLSMMIMRSAKTVWPMDMDIEWKYFSLQNRNRNFFLSYYLEFLVYGSDSSSSLLLLLSVCLYVCYLDTFGQFGFKFPYFFFACCAAVFFRF